MKKSFVFILISLMFLNCFFGSFISGEETNLVKITQETNQTSSKEITKQISSSSNEFLQKDRQIPEGIANIAKIIFGLDSSSISVDKFVVLIVLLICTFFLIYNLIPLVGLFKENLAILVSIIITLLISITGAFKETTDMFFNLFSISLLEEWVILKLISILLTITIIIIIFSPIIQKIKNKIKIEKAERAGEKAGIGVRKLKIEAEELKKYTKSKKKS